MRLPLKNYSYWSKCCQKFVQNSKVWGLLIIEMRCVEFYLVSGQTHSKGRLFHFDQHHIAVGEGFFHVTYNVIHVTGVLLRNSHLQFGFFLRYCTFSIHLQDWVVTILEDVGRLVLLHSQVYCVVWESQALLRRELEHR